MARRKKTKRSGAWFGLVLGMVLGVAAAVSVALFVTKVPMPFKDKASRTPPSTLLPDVANAPDPNIALYGRDGPAGTRSEAQGGSALNPPGEAPDPDGTENPLSDAIGKIISGLDEPAKSPPPPPAASTPPAEPPRVASAEPPAAPARRPAESTAPASTQTTYFLQTGAFRSRDDAQAMLARVVLLGLPVRIETAQSNGTTINRVRVGPFRGIDEMNRARARLGDEKIESAVVRP